MTDKLFKFCLGNDTATYNRYMFFGIFSPFKFKP